MKIDLQTFSWFYTHFLYSESEADCWLTSACPQGQTLPFFTTPSEGIDRALLVLTNPPSSSRSGLVMCQSQRNTERGGGKNIADRRCKSVNMHGWIWQDVLVPVSQAEWSHVCYSIINSAASAASSLFLAVWVCHPTAQQ